ncbi:hypothetical protein K435DRAFT_802695 [Dendrothele bispora CBS 962.96]|uniref:FAD/NAD(P)-binding domain-containing protein n=1 Tax=Dendrothele bispora (strain CBS 962.96) TaxID=1314807 RepID=A0A4S8LJZ8_DENBC|nr:hypothetical protein K435DRAFT_802695 [Dendrothele bispora CBS 962.96]
MARQRSKVASRYSIVPTRWVLLDLNLQSTSCKRISNRSSLKVSWVMASPLVVNGTTTLNGQEDEEPETVDTVIVVTGASAKGLGLKGGEAYRQSGISPCVVCDGQFRFPGTHLQLSSVMVALQPKKLLLPKCQRNGKLLKNLWTRNVQTGSGKVLAVNGLFYALCNRSRQTIMSAGSRCMAALEAERLIAESEEKEIMGE